MILIIVYLVALAIRALAWYVQCQKEFWIVLYCKDITLKAIRDILIFTAIYGGLFWW